MTPKKKYLSLLTIWIIIGLVCLWFGGFYMLVAWFISPLFFPMIEARTSLDAIGYSDEKDDLFRKN